MSEAAEEKTLEEPSTSEDEEAAPTSDAESEESQGAAALVTMA